MKLKELLNKLILPLKGGGIIKLKPYANIVKNIDVQVDGGGDTPQPQPEPEPIEFSINISDLNYNFQPTDENSNTKKLNLSRVIYESGKESNINDLVDFSYDDAKQFFFNDNRISNDNNLISLTALLNPTIYLSFPNLGFNNGTEFENWLNNSILIPLANLSLIDSQKNEYPYTEYIISKNVIFKFILDNDITLKRGTINNITISKHTFVPIQSGFTFINENSHNGIKIGYNSVTNKISLTRI